MESSIDSMKNSIEGIYYIRKISAMREMPLIT